MAEALSRYTARTDSVVALGTFDGVHLGHQALLRRAQQWATAQGRTSAAFVFAEPPGNYLGRPKPMLIPSSLKYGYIERVVERAIYVAFPDLASMQPQAFVEDVLCHRLHATGLVVGQDYRFGKGRSGDTQLLRALGQRYGFELDVVDAVELDGKAVSSTRIRRAICAGDVALAGRLLGRWPLLFGPVVRGEGRGQRLGYPTANLTTDARYAAPEQGIFAAVACVRRDAHPATVYIGTKPTFAGVAGPRVVEVHLLSGTFPPLYDEMLCVHLVEKIRNDTAFEGAHALKVQIQRDLERTRCALAEIDLEGVCDNPTLDPT